MLPSCSLCCSSKALVEALSEVIPTALDMDNSHWNQRIATMYNWVDVAERTEVVYRKVMSTPNPSLLDRFKVLNTALHTHRIYNNCPLSSL